MSYYHFREIDWPLAGYENCFEIIGKSLSAKLDGKLVNVMSQTIDKVCAFLNAANTGSVMEFKDSDTKLCTPTEAACWMEYILVRANMPAKYCPEEEKSQDTNKYLRELVKRISALEIAVRQINDHCSMPDADCRERVEEARAFFSCAREEAISQAGNYQNWRNSGE